MSLISWVSNLVICRTDAETSGATAADAGFAIETKGLPIAPPQSRFANFVEIV